MRVPWGKFDKNGEPGQNVHHLAHHCADVAAVFEALCAVPVIRKRLQSASEVTLSTIVLTRLAVLVFLHDVGKLHPGFQAKGWPDGAWCGPKHGPKHGHVHEGAAIFLRGGPKDIANSLCLDALEMWGVDQHLLFASLAHHGRPFAPSTGSLSWNPVSINGEDYAPSSAAAEMGGHIRAWFPGAFSARSDPLPSTPAFQHLFAGLVALADWVGSDREFFPFVSALNENYADVARQAARRAVQAIGLDVDHLHPLIAGKTGFTDFAPFAEPNAQQKMVGDCSRDERLLIFEAETGSGKTEAALWRFVRLFEAGRVDSLYFAVPTRAAALQLHTRVTRAMTQFLGDDAPQAILAVPGYLKAGEVQGHPLPNWQVRWDDDADDDKLAARWAAENSTRYLAATIAVGTIDQAMLAGLCVKHAHLRAASLSRSLLVIDEVHASDSYMTVVQKHVLQSHLNCGGYAMLMSATLGARARSAWLGASFPSHDEAVASPYPALWVEGHAPPLSVDEEKISKSVAMSLVRTMAAQSAAKIALDAARRGARVLVIRNTVEYAVKTWEAVREAGGGDLLFSVNGIPALHHSRFAPEDRRLLDDAVEAALSTSRGASGRGVIVIGTQTLEQSLDIDADFLLTDLCPVDVLLQRIGRLHRHRLVRPHGFEMPACHVFVPEKGLEPLLEPAFENGLGAWKNSGGDLGGIYRDLAMLELTWRLIADHSVWQIPNMNRMLVEGATHPAKIDALNAELGERWKIYWRDVIGKEIADIGAAKNVLLPTDIPFADHMFPGDEESIRTRLGEAGAHLSLTKPAKGPFGHEISGFTLPAHWSHGLDGSESVTTTEDDDGISIIVGTEKYLYGRSGLNRNKS